MSASELSQKISQSAVTDEIVDNREITKVTGTTRKVLTAEERAARQERAAQREEAAYETTEARDVAWVKAAFEHDTSGGDTSFEMGGGNDLFHFGNWGKRHIAGDELSVDMGEGTDKVRLAMSIEDYTLSVYGEDGITFLNHRSGVEITFTDAETFVFLNRIWVDGKRYNLEDTELTFEEMYLIASGQAGKEINEAESLAAAEWGPQGVGPGDDGLYVNLSIAESNGQEDGNDTFVMDDGFESQTIFGGEDGDDFDTIDLSGLSGGVTVTFTGEESGIITYGRQVITFDEIEHLILTDHADVVDATESTLGDSIDYGAGDDTIDNGLGNDVYAYALGDGSKVINDRSFSFSEIDQLVFTDLNPEDVRISQNAGEDMIITLPDGATITVIDHFDSTVEDIEEIVFADGTVLDSQDIRDRSVADQKADGATILGSDFAETYYHTMGDGSYTIEDFSYFTSEIDRLVLTDQSLDDITFTQNAGRDLVITLSNGETITITDHFHNANEDMEVIELGDGTILDAQTIRNKSVADQKGEAVIKGSALEEDYFHTLGDGSYTIEDFGFGVDQIDRLIFEDESADQVTFTQNSGKDLVITLSNGETVTVKDHFDNANEDMEEIIFDDGTVMSAQDIRYRSVADQKEDGATILGSGFEETYYHSEGDGSYTVKDKSFVIGEEDIFVFEDLTADQVSVAIADNDAQDVIFTLQGGETITFDEQLSTFEGIEEFHFSDGTIWTADTLADML